MAMPRSADASTSVTFASVNEATVFPLGDEASSKIVDNAGPKVVVSTGASFYRGDGDRRGRDQAAECGRATVLLVPTKLETPPAVPMVRSHAR